MVMDPIEAVRAEMRALSGADPNQVQANFALLRQGELAAYEEKLEKATDADARSQLAGKIEALRAKIMVKAQHMSAPGTLPIPKLLEERRWEAGIVDEAFKVAASDSYVFIHQLAVVKGENVTGSQILRADVTVEGERFSAS